LIKYFSGGILIVDKKVFKRLFILFMLLGNGLGIILNLTNSENVAESLSYFTMQSNILVFGFFVFLYFKKKNLSKTGLILQGAFTIAILITFIVYHVLLDPIFGTSNYDPPFWSNFLVHTFTPLMMLLYYLLFTEKGNYLYNHVKYWLIIPVLYFGYANLYAFAGGTFEYNEAITRYPYYFMNPDEIGWFKVILFVLVITFFITLMSILFVYIDHKLVNKKENEHVKEKS